MEPHQAISLILHNLMEGNFKGYDPYDALNSQFVATMPGKISKVALTQLLVYSPINIRPLIGIKKGLNPKTLGLVLSALCHLRSNGLDAPGSEGYIDQVVELIRKNSTKGYSGPCWGYHFPWQDLHKYIPRNEPSIVVSSIIGHSLLDHHSLTDNDYDLDFIRSIGDFIINDLNYIVDDDGLCFSYSPFDENVVHNANLLGASFLFRLARKIRDCRIERTALRSLHFSLKKQNYDGSWYYSIDPKRGTHRSQYDFHQGFILDALRTFWELNKDDEILTSMEKGLKFYLNLVDEEGKAFFRYPKKWPIDIHNQAQLVITFSDYSKIFPFCRLKYEKALRYLLDRMMDGKAHTYHQIWPMITNRNNYSRWGDAWALLALVKAVAGGRT